MGDLKWVSHFHEWGVIGAADIVEKPVDRIFGRSAEAGSNMSTELRVLR
jgi:hypothetical protein